MSKIEGFSNNEIESWILEFGSFPIKVIVSKEESVCGIEKATIFELENGHYAGVFEAGCSCYSSSDAQIDLFETEEKAMDAYNKWWKKR